MLSVNNVNISFNKKKILRDIDLNIEADKLISISGKSGSGKTTLLSIMAGILKPDSGKVLYEGKDIFRWTDIRRSRYRNRKIGFVFQSFNLLPDYTIYQNVIYPALIGGPAGDIKKRADHLLKYLGIYDIRGQYPYSISGGEKQRASIVRAMINNPEIILADEPTGNLDADTGKSIFTLFRNIKNEFGVTFVSATHDKYIIKNSDIRYRIEDGNLVKEK